MHDRLVINWVIYYLVNEIHWSTLGGVLNSHGQCDILFVGVRTSVIVCVCLSGVIVIFRWYLVLYGNILAPQYVRLLDTLVMSEGKG